MAALAGYYWRFGAPEASMQVRRWPTATVTAVLLLSALLSVGTANEGVIYRRWDNIAGASMSEMYADPDYHEDHPHHEEILTDFFETPSDIWYVALAQLRCRAFLTGAIVFL